MASIDLEARRKRIETWAKVLGLGVAAFLFAPFAIATITGLVSLIVVSVIGLLVVNIGLPWFAVTLANWRLKALKAAAAMNPIETLENQYADRQNALLKIRDNIKQSYAVLQQLYKQIQEHNQKYPGTPSQFTDKYTKLQQLVTLRGNKYKQAQQSLLVFGELIEEKRSGSVQTGQRRRRLPIQIVERYRCQHHSGRSESGLLRTRHGALGREQFDTGAGSSHFDTGGHGTNRSEFTAVGA